MVKYRWMKCSRCGWASKVYGHDDPYYCPQCDDEGVESILKEQ